MRNKKNTIKKDKKEDIGDIQSGAYKNIKQYQRVFAHSPLAIVFIDTDGKLIGVNPAFISMLGYDSDELEKMKLSDITHPEDLENELPLFQEIIIGDRNSYEIEKRVLDKNGHVVWINATVFSVRDEKDDIEYLMAFGENFTERREIENTLKKNEEKYRAFVEGAAQPIFSIDRSGIFKFINRVAAQPFYREPEDLIGLSMWDLFQKDIADIQFSRILHVIESKKPASYEEASMINGEERWYDAKINPLFEADGSVESTLVFINDVTDRVIAEEELISNEKRYSLALEATQVGLWDWDLLTGHVYFSPSWEKILNENSLPSKYDTWEKRIHPDDRKKVLKTLRKHLDGKTAKWNCEHRLRTNKGEWIWVLGKGKIIERDENNKPLRMIGKMIDISERKIAEKALKEERDRAQNYLDLARVMFISINKKGEVTLINQKGCEITGYDQDEIIGVNWIDTFIASNKRKEIREVFNKLVAGEIEPTEYHENTIITKNGDERIIAWHNSVIKDDKDNIVNTLSSGEDITERKKAEIKIIESEEKIRDIAENIPGMVYQFKLGVDGIITIPYISSAILEQYGYDPQDIMDDGSLLIKSIHPDDIGLFQDTITASITDLSPFFCEIRMKDKNGQYVWQYIRSIPKKMDDGSIIWTGVSIDVTQQKIAEDALLKSEEKYRLLIENAGQIIVVAQDGMIYYVNNRILDILGYEPEEVYGKVFIDFIHPEDKAYIIDRYEKRMKGEDIPLIYPFRAIDNTGRTVWMEINAVKILWEKKPATLNFLTDITDRKVAEKAMRESEELFSRSFAASPNLMILIDVETGERVDFNAAHKEITGYDREECLGVSLIDDNMFKDPDLFKQGFQVLLKEGKIRDYEMWIIRKDGEERLITYSAELLEASGKRLAIISGIDITHMKKIESEIENHRNHLEELVKERTAELEHKNIELERMNDLFVGRELRIKELRDKIEEYKSIQLSSS